MEDLSLHILDIVENSITAGADKIRIKIAENIMANILTVEIADNGEGMDKEALEKACDPFYTTKTAKRIGLGIPLLEQAAKECMGDIKIKTYKGRGSSITASFQHNHIDRKPLGDIAKTLIVLIASRPDVDFIFEHRKNEKRYFFDTARMKKQLGGVPINSPAVIKFIEDDINTWLNTIGDMIK